MKAIQSCFETKLNGQWYVAGDKDNHGLQNGWNKSIAKEAVPAIFPGFIQDTIGEYNGGTGWFWTEFFIDNLPKGQDCFIRISFYEYIAECWLNGEKIGRLEGRMLIDELLCTDVLQEKTNLLAIRLVAPGEKEQEGYTWNDMPIIFGPDTAPFGGIWDPIRLVFRPKLRIEEILIKTDYKTGNVAIDYEIRNSSEIPVEGDIEYSIISDYGNSVVEVRDRFDPVADVLKKSAEFNIQNHHLWSPKDPFLYTVYVKISGNDMSHTSQVDFGFRKFEVIDGWFHLNGKRIIVKGGFTTDGFHHMGAPMNIEILRKELMKLKAMGLNTMRIHNGVAREEILDMCDRIGLMVIEGHAASWHMKADGRYLEQIYDHHMVHTIKQGINHTCLVAWELINESHSERERHHAVEALQLLRDVDMSRLVFLGSGRWDNEMSIGSVSNPGSRKWECVWGQEDSSAPPAEKPIGTLFSDPDLGEWSFREDDLVCWAPQLGDVHIYTRIPMTWRGKWVLRNHGCHGDKPVYISEFGTSPLGNAIEMTRHLERLEIKPQNERIRSCIACGEFLEREFYHYGLDELYPFPDDLVRASNKQNAYQWSWILDLIRANPKLAGYTYCCTGGTYSALFLLDWFKDIVPYETEAVTLAMQPLHWSLFVDDEHVYENAPFTVEAVLACEDGEMQPGTYPVSARIVSAETGCVWEYHTDVTIPKPEKGKYQPLCYTVFKEEVRIEKAGVYQCVVNLDKGGDPSGGKREVTVTADRKLENVKVAAIGIDDEKKAWLEEHGVLIDEAADTILVGNRFMDDQQFDDLMKKAEAGSNVIILCPEVLLRNVEDPYQWWTTNVPERLPVKNKGKLLFSDNWAYRVNTVLKKHSYSKDLPLGLLSDAYWNQIEPYFVFEESDDPDEIIGVTIAAPYFDKDADETHGTLSGTTLGVYQLGKGRMVVNSFRILEELGNNPAAGNLLLNIIKTEQIAGNS